MHTQWNGCQIHSEQIDDDLWEAQLEHDEGGPLGTGSTEIAARADLIDQLRADLAEAWVMAEAMLDDKAHAARDRRAGL